jgi:uncharacterized protein YeeX (DUF496 family)
MEDDLPLEDDKSVEAKLSNRVDDELATMPRNIKDIREKYRKNTKRIVRVKGLESSNKASCHYTDEYGRRRTHVDQDGIKQQNAAALRSYGITPPEDAKQQAHYDSIPKPPPDVFPEEESKSLKELKGNLHKQKKYIDALGKYLNDLVQTKSQETTSGEDEPQWKLTENQKKPPMSDEEIDKAMQSVKLDMTDKAKKEAIRDLERDGYWINWPW